MAVDMFLVIDGEIEGETKDHKYEGEGGIDLLAFSWGMSQGGSFHQMGGGGAGKAAFQDVSCTIYVDKATPVLMNYVANGDHFPKAKIVCRKAGKKPLEYLTIKMDKVLITSYSTGGSMGEERLTANITMNFAEVEVYYVEQTDEGGEGAKPDFKWNIRTNEAK